MVYTSPIIRNAERIFHSFQTVREAHLKEHVKALKPREQNYLNLFRETQDSLGHFLIPLASMETEVRSAEVGTNGKRGPGGREVMWKGTRGQSQVSTQTHTKCTYRVMSIRY